MSSVSTLALLLRLVVSLAVVVGLMLGASAFMRRRGFGGLAPMKGGRRSPAASQVEVLARKSLGRNASIAVVRAGEKSLVLGVTDSTVTMLAETELEDIEFEEIEAPRTGYSPFQEGTTTPWKTALQQLRDRTVRRT